MYTDLIAWQKSYQFTLDIYKVTRTFPKNELYGITSQMRRACASIPANIAEGSMRESPKTFRQFVRIARGSMAEMEVWIRLSYDLGYIDQEGYNSLHRQCNEVGKLLFGLLNSI